MQLKTLAYTSRARLDLTDEDLREIHQTARHLNALDGVTGLLIFDGARFLQIVEGAEEAVDSLVERLRRDPRHLSFEIRDERSVADRSFPDWSMELLQVRPGYVGAGSEIASRLPQHMSPAIRDLALRMSGDLAASAD